MPANGLIIFPCILWRKEQKFIHALPVIRIRNLGSYDEFEATRIGSSVVFLDVDVISDKATIWFNSFEHGKPWEEEWTNHLVVGESKQQLKKKKNDPQVTRLLKRISSQSSAFLDEMLAAIVGTEETEIN